MPRRRTGTSSTAGARFRAARVPARSTESRSPASIIGVRSRRAWSGLLWRVHRKRKLIVVGRRCATTDVTDVESCDLITAAVICIKHITFINSRAKNWPVYNQVRLSSVTAVYPHMPILRVACAHARFARAMAVRRAYVPWAAMARVTRTIRQSLFVRFGFLGSKLHKNGRFPALNADKAPCKIWRR